MKDKNKLTPKQERFTLNLFKGLSQRQAYIKAGYSSRSNGDTLDVRACELVADSKIKVRLDELRDGARRAAVMDQQERQERLTVVAKADFKAPVSARESVLAIAELNKMDHIYDEKPQYQDNRQYTIVVQGDEAKARFNELLAGKMPEETEEGE